MQQLLLGRQLGLALWADLADEDVARPDAGADADHAVLVQVVEHLLRDIGDVACELLAAELGLAHLDVERVDVDGREDIVLDQPLGDDDGILEVVPVKRVETDEHVLADRQLALPGRGAVGDDLILLDALAHPDKRALVLARALVEPDELAEHVLVRVVDDHALGIDVGDGAGGAGLDRHPGVDADVLLKTRGHARRIDLDERDRLPLHVRAHEGAVGVVMLEEGDEGGRDSHDLFGCDVDEIDLRGIDLGQLAVDTGQDRAALERAVQVQRVGRRQHGADLLVSTKIDDLLGDLAALDLSVRRAKEAVVVDRGEDAQRRDQPDVGALGGLDGADPAVVADVHVADLEPGPLAVEPARAQRGQATLVHEAGQRVGLVHDLAQLAAPEEEVDGRGDGLAVDEVGDLGQLVRILDAHALLNGASELEEALSQLLDSQLVQRAQTPVPEMVDIVDLGHGSVGLGIEPVGPQVEDVLDDAQEVFAPDEHQVRGGVQRELAVDAESADSPQTIPVDVEKLFDEELLGLLDLRRVARAQLRVDLEQRALVLGLGRLELLEILLGHGVEDQRVRGVLDDVDGLERRVEDGLDDLLPDLTPDVHELLAGLGVDDGAGGPLLGPDVRSLDLVDLVEEAQDSVGFRDGIVEAAEEGCRRELGGLVDAHRQHIFLGHLQLDPRAALRDDARRVERAVALARDDGEVHAGRAVELTDDDTLGPVDDELAAAHHDRELAEVDVLLGEVRPALAPEPNGDAERAPVGEAQLTTFVGGIARLFEGVTQVFKPHRPVV